jgi:cytochrome b6-f complex iron-sulfur subunit
MKLLSAVVALLCASMVSAFTASPSFVASRTSAIATRVGATAEEYYIDDERRFVMNLLMVGAGGLTVVGFGLPFILFFFPPGTGGGTGGTPAKDALGNDILAKAYLESKPALDRSLAQGLKGDATYVERFC